MKKEKLALERDKGNLERELKKYTDLLSKATKNPNALQQLADENTRLKEEIDFLNEIKSQNDFLKEQVLKQKVKF